MDLELVPMEGEKVLTEEEKERLKRRVKPVPPEKLEVFSEADQKLIKNFLIQLIAVTEQIHHDMIVENPPSDLKEHEDKMHTLRRHLFTDQHPAVKSFCELLEISPAEPWQEFEVLISELLEEDRRHFFEIKNENGIKAAIDNPFLMQEEDYQDRAEEERIALTGKSRITPHEIGELINLHSLEDIVNDIISARNVISGQFWQDQYYDL